MSDSAREGEFDCTHATGSGSDGFQDSDVFGYRLGSECLTIKYITCTSPLTSPSTYM